MPTRNSFILGGDREMVDEARALELLEPYLVNGKTDHTAISLRNKSYSEAAAECIAKTLQALYDIKVVDLADIIAGRPEEEALRVLEIICSALGGNQFLEIDLSDNALGEKGVRACFGVLQNQHSLERLFFCNNGISAAAAGVIANEIVLFRGPDVPTSLRVFQFYNNMSGDGGAKELAKILPLSPELEEVTFSATRSGREGSLEFAKGIATLRKLTKLDLSDNTFDLEGASVIAEAIQHQKDLVFLNLRDTALMDEGVLPILEALTLYAPKLETLDLSGNELTSESITALAKCIASKRHLRVVMLEENEIGSAGARLLAKGLEYGSSHLSTVILNTNEIGAVGAIALVNSLKNKKSLVKLEINGNMISEDGLETITCILDDIGKSCVLGVMDDNDTEVEEEELGILDQLEELETQLQAALQNYDNA